MFRKIIRLIALPALVIIVSNSPQLQAGVSGKISGIVTDAKTAEPIVGATILVKGTSISTLTDIDGEFFIINLPAGKYEVTAKYLGYETVTVSEVRILTDLTTPIDFELNDAAVVLSKEIIISAVNPIIQRDLTSSQVTYTAEQLQALPNTTDLYSILSKFPGVVTDKDLKIHVRGGRSGQLVYYYDGFSVQDPFTYAAGMRIMPSALEEISLTSGGYTAEYGEALSGVVNAVTREGGAEYHGGIRMYEGMTHSYDVYTGEWKKLDFQENRSASFNLSGPIIGLDPKKYNFFVAGEYLRDPSYLPSNWSISYNGTSKFTMRPMPNMKILTNFSYYKDDGRLYDHRDVNGVSYDFNLDGLPAFRKRAYLAGITGNYNFSENMILSATIDRFYTRTLSAPQQLMDTYWNKWPGYSETDSGTYNGTIDNENYGAYENLDFTDPMQVVGYTVGDDFLPAYRFRRSEYNSFKVSLLNQVNKIHQVKTGIEYRKFDIMWDTKLFYNTNPYGEKYETRPVYLSAYIQDKMEYTNFIVNLGIRYDLANSDISYNYAPRDDDPDNNFDVILKEAESKSKFSPRLGVSFPISEKSMMHFNYGVYYQYSKFTNMYINLDGDISTGYPLLGNPDLEPEQTTSYELGMDHLIGDDLRLDITAYYKDIDNLVSTRSFYAYTGLAVTQFTNDDYGFVKGLDFSFEKLPGNSYFRAKLDYSYMIAKGNGSYEREPYYTYITSVDDNLAPLTSYPLDFDQRHTITALVSYKVPRNWKGDVFGVTIPGGWIFTSIGQYGSGLPFTATDNTGNRLGDRNENRLPAHYSIDIKFSKNFYVGLSDNFLSAFIEIDNLFDRRNIVNVYSRTGSPDDDGQATGSGLALDQKELNKYDRLYDHDPQNYSLPRTIRTGLEFNF